MKRLFIVAIPALFALTLVGCKKEKAQQDEQTTADSLAQAANDEQIWHDDSVRWAQRRTYDLTFCDVHGPVRSVMIEGEGANEFDKEGRLILHDGYNPFSSEAMNHAEGCGVMYTRDEKGRINEIHGHEYMAEYTWDGTRISKYEWGSEGDCNGNTKYSYDERDFIVSEDVYESFWGGEEINSETIKYTYTEIDEYGNWTARKNSTGGAQRRIITYYPFK